MGSGLDDGADIDMVEVVPDMVYASSNMPPDITAILRQAVADVAAARAHAPEEARKASAPCHGCGRIMPAAERCAGCVASGAWFCAACHARFEGELEGGGANALAATMLN